MTGQKFFLGSWGNRWNLLREIGEIIASVVQTEGDWQLLNIPFLFNRLNYVQNGVRYYKQSTEDSVESMRCWLQRKTWISAVHFPWRGE